MHKLLSLVWVSLFLVILFARGSKGNHVPYQRTEAENYDTSSGVTTNQCPDGRYHVQGSSSSSYIEFKDVQFDLKPNGASMITLGVSSQTSYGAGGYILITKGSKMGTPVANIPIQTIDSYSWCTFLEITNFLLDIQTGTEDLYFSFSGSTYPFVSIDYFYFEEAVPDVA